MLIIDGHLDLAMNALYLERDLRMSAHEQRALEAGKSGSGRGAGTVGFPDMRAGGVGLCFATFIARARRNGSDSIDVGTHEAAHAHAMGQFSYYREMERQGAVRIISDSAALYAHVAEWNANPETTPIGLVLSMEGADPIVEPASLGEWNAIGLHIVSLVHYGESQYAWGTGTDGPVKPAGLKLLAEMERTNTILDVTHLCDQAFSNAMDAFHGPVLATHSNCRALVPDGRQFSDEQLKTLIERGAVIGSALDAWMLTPGWIKGETTPANTTMKDFVDQIDHVCQLAGNAGHAAIGTDLDGGYGTEQTPGDLDTIADLARVPGMLSDRGYTQTDIEKIMHGNWIALLNRVWG
jgi:membrane dipeptidase